MSKVVKAGDHVETVNGVGRVLEVRHREAGVDYLIITGKGSADVYGADEFETNSAE